MIFSKALESYRGYISVALEEDSNPADPKEFQFHFISRERHQGGHAHLRIHALPSLFVNKLAARNRNCFAEAQERQLQVRERKTKRLHIIHVLIS